MISEEGDHGAVGDRHAGDDIGGHHVSFCFDFEDFGFWEEGLFLIREDEVVGIDDAPCSALGIDDSDAGFFTEMIFQGPNDLAHREGVFAEGLHDDFVVDEELDGGLAWMISAGNLEAEEGEFDLEFRGGEFSGRGITAVGRTGVIGVGVAGNGAVHAIRTGGGGCFSKGGSFCLPLAEAVGLKSVEDEIGGRCRKGKSEKKGGEAHESGGKREIMVEVRKLARNPSKISSVRKCSGPWDLSLPSLGKGDFLKASKDRGFLVIGGLENPDYRAGPWEENG